MMMLPASLVILRLRFSSLTDGRATQKRTITGHFGHLYLRRVRPKAHRVTIGATPQNQRHAVASGHHLVLPSEVQHIHAGGTRHLGVYPLVFSPLWGRPTINVEFVRKYEYNLSGYTLMTENKRGDLFSSFLPQNYPPMANHIPPSLWGAVEWCVQYSSIQQFTAVASPILCVVLYRVPHIDVPR